MVFLKNNLFFFTKNKTTLDSSQIKLCIIIIAILSIIVYPMVANPIVYHNVSSLDKLSSKSISFGTTHFVEASLIKALL